MPSFKHHPSSYRDPSGFIFYQDGQLYRQVNLSFREDFDFFINGGLYRHLVENNWIIPHTDITENLTGTPEWYQTIKPEPIPYISYPYEWCFDMLKDAALLTLQLAREAMNYGMMLKDASSFNLQWHRGRMMFVDTLSFERYNEQQPWIAYKQFCEHFFAPLALMHYLQMPVQHLYSANPDGLPIQLASRFLPFKSKLNLHVYLHLHLHSSIAAKPGKQEEGKPFSRKKMQNLLQSLEDGIRSFHFDKLSGVWSGYYDEAFQRDDYISHKKQILHQWIQTVQWSTALDAGTNEGEFTELLKDKAALIISADFDHYSINNLYKKIKAGNLSNIHPVLMDLSNPSPATGVNNQERTSFIDRTRTDLVMALALIHHLAIGKNISFSQIAEMFNRLGKCLLIEFVPKEDEKVQLMLQHKKDVYHWYTEENFIAAFEGYFKIADSQKISGTKRTLYLMQSYATI